LSSASDEPRSGASPETRRLHSHVGERGRLSCRTWGAKRHAASGRLPLTPAPPVGRTHPALRASPFRPRGRLHPHATLVGAGRTGAWSCAQKPDNVCKWLVAICRPYHLWGPPRGVSEFARSACDVMLRRLSLIQMLATSYGERRCYRGDIGGQTIEVRSRTAMVRAAQRLRSVAFG
jgi:hypothetical protein